MTVPTNAVGGDTFYFASFGVGHYWKGDDKGSLRQQRLILVATYSTLPPGGGPGPKYLSVTPGYRVEIHDGWSFLAGVEVPLTSHSPFATQPIFLLAKEF